MEFKVDMEVVDAVVADVVGVAAAADEVEHGVGIWYSSASKVDESCC